MMVHATQEQSREGHYTFQARLYYLVRSMDTPH